MGHRVLGIAVGTEAVRVAVVETRLRRFELKAAVDTVLVRSARFVV